MFGYPVTGCLYTNKNVVLASVFIHEKRVTCPCSLKKKKLLPGEGGGVPTFMSGTVYTNVWYCIVLYCTIHGSEPFSHRSKVKHFVECGMDTFSLDIINYIHTYVGFVDFLKTGTRPHLLLFICFFKSAQESFCYLFLFQN